MDKYLKDKYLKEELIYSNNTIASPLATLSSLATKNFAILPDLSETISFKFLQEETRQTTLPGDT